MGDLFDDLLDEDIESEPQKVKKEKKRFFKKSQPKPEKHKEDEGKEPKRARQMWKRFTSDLLTENDKIEEVEDVVDRPEREIGTLVKKQISINEARKVDMTFRERLQLTKLYINEDEEELRRLEAFSLEEETRNAHIITLRSFLLTELSTYLTDVNQELTLEIDAKFGEYIEDVLKEVRLSYLCREIPRNSDLVRLNPNLPYKYSFMIKAI